MNRDWIGFFISSVFIHSLWWVWPFSDLLSPPQMYYIHYSLSQTGWTEDIKHRWQQNDADLSLRHHIWWRRFFTSSGFHALCPLPCCAALSWYGIYNQIKYSFVWTPHPSPQASDFRCTSAWITRLGLSDGVMTRPQTSTKAHVQKSNCFVVCSGMVLCFQQPSSKQWSLNHVVTGEWTTN